MKVYDLSIIGTGPAGLSTAIFAQRLGISSVVFGDTPGGNLYMIEKVENYPGYPDGVPGAALGVSLFKQAQKEGANLTLKTCKTLSKEGELFHVTAEGGEEFLSRASVIACGLTPKLPELPAKVSKGIHLCAVCDGPLYRGKDARLAIIGGGNTAGTQAQLLSKIAKEIHIIHRGQSLKMEKVLERKLLQDPKVKLWLCAEVVEILGQEHVEAVAIRQPDSSVRVIPVNGLFIAAGWIPKLDFLKIQVELTAEGFIKTDSSLNTSEPGLFAAGDIRDTDLRQIITACADGARVAYSVSKWLTTDAELFFQQ